MEDMIQVRGFDFRPTDDALQALQALRRSTSAFRRAAVAVGVALAPTVRQATKALRAFGEAYYDAAERGYIAVHGRLPGSTRTSRLRKKRRDAVLRWFNAELDAWKP